MRILVWIIIWHAMVSSSLFRLLYFQWKSYRNRSGICFNWINLFRLKIKHLCMNLLLQLTHFSSCVCIVKWSIMLSVRIIDVKPLVLALKYRTICDSSCVTGLSYPPPPRLSLPRCTTRLSLPCKCVKS